MTSRRIRPIVVSVAIALWVTGTVFVASEHGAERRMAFDGAVRR